jgi:uncharacterized protein (DUF1501 family)
MTSEVTRRRFLELTGALAAAGVTTPLWLRAGEAAALEPGVRQAAGRKLIVMLLGGGNDGLNTVVPYASAAYYARRPTIAHKPTAVLKLKGSNDFGLHPSLKTVHDLYGKGNVAIVQGVGYDHPNLSHFESMDVWHTGSPTLDVTSGWLGRWLDVTPDEGRAIRAIAVGDYLPTTLVGAATAGVAIPSLNGFTFYDGIDTTAKGPQTETEAYRLHQAFLTCVEATPADRMALAYTTAGRRAVRAVRAVNAMSDPAKAQPPATLADQVSLAVTLLASSLGVEIAFVTVPASFDDHAAQVANHAKTLTIFDDAVARFVEAAAATGKPADYLLLTISEFGRRPEENGSGGTDHGTAAPLFAIGRGVEAGLHGVLPNLDMKSLDENKNLVRTVELREVFATVIEKWLGRADAKDVLRYSGKDGIHPVAFLR